MRGWGCGRRGCSGRGQVGRQCTDGSPASRGQTTAYADLVRKLALPLLIAITVLSIIVGWIWLVHRPSEVEKAVQAAAEAGAFPPAVGYMYSGDVDCRVEEVEAFLGHDLYLCKLGFKGLDVPGGQYIYAAIVDGKLHTHQTDPAEIPGRVFDPAF